MPLVEEYERHHHRQIPEHWRGVRHKKAPVTVEDSQAPGGEDEQSRSREKDSSELDRQLPLLTGKAVRDDGDEPRRCEDAQGHNDRGDERQHSDYRAGKPSRLILISFPQESRILRNERSGKHTLAEQILKHVGDAERRVERIGCHSGAEVSRHHRLADESGQPAQENARAYQECCALGSIERLPGRTWRRPPFDRWSGLGYLIGLGRGKSWKRSI